MMANTQNVSPTRPSTPLSSSTAQGQQQQQEQLKPLFASEHYPISSSPVVSRPSQPTATTTHMALEQYRLQLYNYALNIERLRCPPYGAGNGLLPSWLQPSATYGAVHSGGNRLATLSTISLFPQTQRIFQPEEPKPQHSYIGLIAMAILSSGELKLVLSDIYQYILDNYPYFRSRGPGWRNSIRHNLSLNDCFIKSGRSANGKGHYWAIHPANMDDFRKGDFRRRKAQRKVRKHMGLSVDDASTDSPSPPPLDLTTPPPVVPQAALNYPYNQQQQQQQQQHYIGQFFGRGIIGAQPRLDYQQQQQQREQQQHQLHQLHPQQHPQYPQHPQHISYINSTTTTTIANLYSQTRKRQFDVASLLAPDVQIVDIVADDGQLATQTQHTLITKVQVKKQQMMVLEQHPAASSTSNNPALDVDAEAEIDVEDCEEEQTADGAAPGTAPAAAVPAYLSDAELEERDAHNYSPVLGSSNDSNSLEECALNAAGTAADTLLPPSGVHPLPISYVELNGVDPQILSRYYGSYMAAAARRASLEAAARAQSKATLLVATPPPAISSELLPNKS